MGFIPHYRRGGGGFLRNHKPLAKTLSFVTVLVEKLSETILRTMEREVYYKDECLAA
jgi:hypothetical protein